jgi:hypothetical protein
MDVTVSSVITAETTRCGKEYEPEAQPDDAPNARWSVKPMSAWESFQRSSQTLVRFWQGRFFQSFNSHPQSVHVRRIMLRMRRGERSGTSRQALARLISMEW